jgi:hypothetical protein
VSLPETAVLSTFTRSLRCDLTREEHIEKAEELAALIEEEEATKAVHASRRKAMREAELLHHAQVLTVREDVARGSEFRDTEVKWVAHYAENIAKLVRTDTGETLQVRELAAHEQQAVLPLAPKAGPVVEDLAEDDDLPAEV